MRRQVRGVWQMKQDLPIYRSEFFLLMSSMTSQYVKMSRFTLWNQFMVHLNFTYKGAILTFLPMKNYPPNYHIFSLIHFWILSNLTNLHLGKILHFQLSLNNNFDCVFNLNLQCSTMLIKFKQCWNLTADTTFVNISAGLSIVWIFCIMTPPFSMISRMKWYRTSMCFVLAW